MLYEYGMRLRPFAPLCQPMKGLVSTDTDPSKKYWTILTYDRKLTEKEVRDYELDEIHRG